MARKQGNRVLITLACSDCRERNYASQKNRRNDTQRIELTKFCPRCGGHRVHREVR
jgi:large subunit ribosomal protein L33